MKKDQPKSNFKLLTFIVLCCSIICNSYLRLHMVTDTYNVLYYGYDTYSETFLKDGRIISFLMLQLGNFINCDIKIFLTFMSVLAVLFQSISVFLIYKEFNKKISDIDSSMSKKIIMLLGSFLIIYNPFSIEHLAYAESAVMCLGTLLCVISAIKINNPKVSDQILSLFLVLISGICYQGVLNIFATLSIVFLLTDKELNFKHFIKTAIKIFIILLLSLVVVYAAISIGNNILNSTHIESRLRNEIVDFHYIIETLPGVTLYVLYYNMNLYPKGIMLIAILLTILFILRKKDYAIHILKFITIILVATLSCILPIYLMKTPCIEARMSSSIGAILGICIIYVSLIKEEKKIINNIVFFIAVILFTINLYNYINIGQLNIKTNAIDKYICEMIDSKIENYENTTNIKVTDFAYCLDSNSEATYQKMPRNTYTSRGLKYSYCIEGCLNYYTRKKFKN